MYRLPTYISEDPVYADLLEIFNVIVVRLQEESKGVPMNTLQLMLLERVATNYIILRWRERQAVGTFGAFEHTTAAKDFNSFWLQSHKELNSQIGQKSEEEVLSSIAKRFGAVIDDVLSGMPESQATDLRGRFADAFSTAGL
jgi:hypothetical protein